MKYDFQVGRKYTRKDIYRKIGVPEDTRGGNWDTGYNRHGNAWFLFCNVGSPGRTKHDYPNVWIGDDLQWIGKTNAQASQPSIRSMTDGTHEVYVFWRAQSSEPFTFAGLGKAKEVHSEVVPVKINWSFD